MDLTSLISQRGT